MVVSDGEWLTDGPHKPWPQHCCMKEPRTHTQSSGGSPGIANGLTLKGSLSDSISTALRRTTL